MGELVQAPVGTWVEVSMGELVQASVGELVKASVGTWVQAPAPSIPKSSSIISTLPRSLPMNL